MTTIGFSPLLNTIILFIIIIALIIIIKPKFIYSKKTQKYKTFGSKKNQSLCCFPVFVLFLGIGLYFIFLIAEITINNLDK
jgi:hypothetical protein